MKIISPTVHAILDYATVIFLLAAPLLFNMEGALRTFTYALAGIHFLLTILTSFPLGLIKVIPFRIHGLIEVVVALAVAGAAFWFKNNDSLTGFYLYLVLAAIIMLFFVLTDFKEKSPAFQSKI